MANNTAISNEEVIAALLQHGTIKEAAEVLKITPRTIYDRMNDAKFREEYNEMKNDILRSAANNVNGKLAEAINTVAEIMSDKEVNPAVRPQAAQAIFSNAEKFTSRLNEGEAKSYEIAHPDPLTELF